MDKKINIIIVDDHPIVLNGLKSLLSNIEQLNVVGEATNGIEALNEIKGKEVDLVVSDISMPEMDGVELTAALKESLPEIKVMLLTAFNEREILKKALFSGAEACLLKNTSKKELIKAIEIVMDCGYYYCDNIMDIAGTVYNDNNSGEEENVEEDIVLSSRELEVLELLLHGYSNKEVATKLSISYHTVTTHRKNTMKKTNSKNISSLYNYAKKNNLFTDL